MNWDTKKRGSSTGQLHLQVKMMDTEMEEDRPEKDKLNANVSRKILRKQMGKNPQYWN